MEETEQIPWALLLILFFFLIAVSIYTGFNPFNDIPTNSTRLIDKWFIK